MTHAFFKALLFLGSGAVIHSMHHALHHTHKDWDAQDMRNMGGLRRYLPITWITMWIGTLAIAGVWPFAGFFSKDEIIWQTAARATGPFEVWFRIFWIMALLAAMLTAFYMTRLMIMTFHGRNRTGEKESAHLHEAPAVMYVPLIILAIASVVGGWINVPEAIAKIPVLGWIPHSEWLHEWLHPITASADDVIASNVGPVLHESPFGGGEAAWAAISFAIATIVIVLTARALGRRLVRPATESRAPAGFGKVLYNKWYVDELYDKTVVRPLLVVSRASWRYIDQTIIDGLVNGAGRAARLIGFGGSKLQSGQLNTYAFAIVVGVIVVLGILLVQ
jgi:NADH-quinone oxidoreductase subunit L